jgi:hypothetical protein
MINGGHAENALPQTATAMVNCIGVRSFYEGQQFLYLLVKEYSGKTSLKRDY